MYVRLCFLLSSVCYTFDPKLNRFFPLSGSRRRQAQMVASVQNSETARNNTTPIEKASNAAFATDTDAPPSPPTVTPPIRTRTTTSFSQRRSQTSMRNSHRHMLRSLRERLFSCFPDTATRAACLPSRLGARSTRCRRVRIRIRIRWIPPQVLLPVLQERM